MRLHPEPVAGRIGYGCGLTIDYFDAKRFQRLPQRSLSMDGQLPLFMEFFLLFEIAKGCCLLFIV